MHLSPLGLVWALHLASHGATAPTDQHPLILKPTESRISEHQKVPSGNTLNGRFLHITGILTPRYLLRTIEEAPY